VISLAATSGPALSEHQAIPYVAAAYVVFLAILLIYVGIMATRLGRSERDLTELTRDVEAARSARDSAESDETVAERV
jgi:flagellar biosynthesis/type III secretory pathway M-ring protein FliF/YscJ